MAQERIIFGIRTRLKSESKLMKIIGWFAKPFNPLFMTEYWTTLGSVIYAPSSFNLNDIQSHAWYKEIFDHEKVHIQDFETYGLLYEITYFLPYFRFVWERRAYLPELVELAETHKYKDFYNRLNEICDNLGGSQYFWAWYKPWIKKWFLKETGMS